MRRLSLDVAGVSVPVEVVEDTDEAVAALTKVVAHATRVAIDTEVEMSDDIKHPGDLVTIQVAARAHHGEEAYTKAFVLVMQPGKVDPAAVADLIAELGPRAAGHNSAFDEKVLWRAGIPVELAEDTMLMHTARRLGMPGARFRSLADLSAIELGVNIEGKGEVQTSFTRDGQLSDEQLRYAGLDAVATLMLADRLRAAFDVDGGQPYHALRVNLDAQPMVAWMESTGMHFDMDGWAAEVEMAKQEAAEVESKVAMMVGFGQANLITGLMEVPQGRMGSVEWQKKMLNELAPEAVAEVNGKPFQANDGLTSDTLKILENQHGSELAGLFLQWRALSKRISTYGPDAYEEHMRNGRMYAQYNLMGAGTGRMSSDKPNMQNIDPAMKRHFRSPKGRVKIKADYSAQELRVAASVFRGLMLLEIFANGGDAHLATAKAMFGEEQAKGKRPVAKGINFGQLYGQGAARLALALTVNGLPTTVEEAKHYLKLYADAQPEIVRGMQARDDWVQNFADAPPLCDWDKTLRLHELELVLRPLVGQLRTQLGYRPDPFEIADALVREGHEPADADRDALAEEVRQWQSFDVPVVIRADGEPLVWDSQTWSGAKRFFTVSTNQLVDAAVQVVGMSEKPAAEQIIRAFDAERDLGLVRILDETSSSARSWKGRRNRAERISKALRDKPVKFDFVRFAIARTSADALLPRALSDQISATKNQYRNHPIQGGAAEVTLMAMKRVYDVLLRYDNAVPLQTVHDSVVVECAEEDAYAVARDVREAMEAAQREAFPDIPAVVDVEIGPTLDSDEDWDAQAVEEGMAAALAAA